MHGELNNQLDLLRRIHMSEVARKKEILLTAGDVAKRLSLSTRTIFRLRSSGKLPEAVLINKSVRWRESDIQSWIEGGCKNLKTFQAYMGESK